MRRWDLERIQQKNYINVVCILFQTTSSFKIGILVSCVHVRREGESSSKQSASILQTKLE